ncbi:uncharacterized protein LOC117890816 [Drosophila subobscura]|uniref:uncharacterized protein LOC117890816 n=1 Tax=Drosophila subobscura TaxID=7241 RepID=UPI00155A8199|nr:uncharacterized protein LOC117890816 [Drosophila subobscura]
MHKFKRKVYRKYEDFIRPQTHKEPDAPKPINLSIDDFNARGEIANPRAPCVVTTIDPDYITDASAQRLAKKFRMKTDVLLLRDITRNRFMYYATQEMFLDRKREKEHQDRLYEKADNFHKFAEESLKKMEAEEFKKMLQAQQKLKMLKENKVADELNEVKLEHQRVLMEVQEVYGRFQYLLKLISYFDDTVDELAEEGPERDRLTMPKEIVCMEISERHPAGLEQVQQVQSYMEKVVRPYLAKRNHLDADVWIRGYERNRLKVSNYNRRFTQLALLNHIVSILHDKAQKTFERKVTANVFLKDPEFLQRRVAGLQQRATELLSVYEQSYCKDKLNIKLNSIVPVILRHIQNKVQPEQKKEEPMLALKPAQKSSRQWRTMEDMQAPLAAAQSTYEDEQDTTLAKVEKIQSYVMELLSQLDRLEPSKLRSVEQQVRRRMAAEKEMSRRALVKQNRLHNWMEHFKKHHRLQLQQRRKNKL